MTILERILEVKRLEVKQLLMEERDVSCGTLSKRPSLFETLKHSNLLEVISEMKRASPSKGMIAGQVDPVTQATTYERAGAACISVLTDKQFFKGSFDDLAAVSKAVQIPLLCKDFIIHEVQIDRAMEAGASVILLIVAALDEGTLQRLHTYATGNGLEVLVEVHDAKELSQALSIDAKLIGVNNRDLRTFEVDLSRTEEISRLFPFNEDHVFISESGIMNGKDAKRVATVGASAVLVGESLMRSASVEDSLHSLQVPKGGVLQ
ncbi:indole-3-glycerol phosphate synthase TrpC [Sporosarcina thermotolerans]|uniref:Indole-3-glycerol phosphate synthase n=1 Tax=Sporosarcina thermotolerans TaxID=633404 RepID=A0AAW9AAI2_9BACL|nr:indole-3-glycerol phosphate synthase TrpC [Sporosarcina thermotolerans]MDW0116601.1 indole-3-glycerol phosphate synthase TrpC [Sporosarcina thermotolerans]WHT48815.1 indole-3-glycerol phosphate synthase TrpC [Sporosarcina thermotolerans]